MQVVCACHSYWGDQSALVLHYCCCFRYPHARWSLKSLRYSGSVLINCLCVVTLLLTNPFGEQQGQHNDS